jgi:hypothetical protein
VTAVHLSSVRVSPDHSPSVVRAGVTGPVGTPPELHLFRCAGFCVGYRGAAWAGGVGQVLGDRAAVNFSGAWHRQVPG